MTNPLAKVRTTIRLTVVVVFLLGILLTATVAIGLQFYFGETQAREAAGKLYTSVSGGIAMEMASVSRLNENIIELLASWNQQGDGGEDALQLEVFTGVLERNPLFYGVYIGRANGDFLEVINLDTNEKTRQGLEAQAGERWAIVSVNGDGDQRLRHYRYLDDRLAETRRRAEPTDFDPSERPWYRNAISTGEVYRTAPYLFAQLGVPGRTISKRIGETDSVVAIDMTLAAISDYLRQNKISPESTLFLYSADGRIVASSRGVDDASTEMADRIFVDIASDETRQGQLQEASIRGVKTVIYGSKGVIEGENSLYIGIEAPTAELLAPYLNRVKLSAVGTSVAMLLLLPLAWLFATPIVEPVRQLARENDKIRRRDYQSVSRIESPVKELDELSESMVNMVGAIQAHEIEQRRLMDAFIQLIAQAIDDKSAYTGGHCERVPELAFMLARRASDSNMKPFDTFSLDTEDQWREYQIAAWLHDCGKITTPEHIVDKGSKLETIYNRLHEVRMRFEVLWRDAEISFWEAYSKAPENRTQLMAALQKERQQLQEDYTFVAQCNVGGEFFDEQHRVRLEQIAKITWQRNFDDQIGLSPVEELRQTEPSATLPATENLLSDKPEHIIPRTRTTEYPSEFGINMDIPEHLYNQGEVYNLTISRGTLTAEDRFKINEHMISTIKMLESLPFPDELRNVPRYASTHHETMSGTGYPRKLPGEELSIPERILAVADVFEALTAADRPYKKAKPVSVAIDILHKMVQNNHIDSSCFELFLREGVYLQYAEKFLGPEQIDEVDMDKYLQAS